LEVERDAERGDGQEKDCDASEPGRRGEEDQKGFDQADCEGDKEEPVNGFGRRQGGNASANCGDPGGAGNADGQGENTGGDPGAAGRGGGCTAERGGDGEDGQRDREGERDACEDIGGGEQGSVSTATPSGDALRLEAVISCLRVRS
jgi:hypothetical protein